MLSWAQLTEFGIKGQEWLYGILLYRQEERIFLCLEISRHTIWKVLKFGLKKERLGTLIKYSRESEGIFTLGLHNLTRLICHGNYVFCSLYTNAI